MSFSKIRQAQGLVFVSSEVAHSSEGRASGDAAEQTAQALAHLASTLQNVGLTLDDVVQVTAFLRQPEDFAPFNQMYSTCFKEPFPARTTVLAQSLYPNACIEIQIVAALRQEGLQKAP